MEINDILSEICGTAEDGGTKTLICLTTSKINPKDIHDITEENVIGTEEAVIQIYPASEDIIQMDFIFPDSDNESMYDLWYAMEAYKENLGKYVGKVGDRDPADVGDPYPFLLINLVPLEESDESDGNYYLSATAPLLQVLTSMRPNQMPSCIRMLFHMDNLALLETDEDFGFEEIDAEIVSELARKEAYREMDEEDQERRQREADRMEELRKKHMRF